MTSAQ